MLILLITFLKHTVTILGELVPHERFPQTGGIIPLVKKLFTYSRFQDERERLTALAVLPLVVSLAFFGCSSFLRKFP